MNAPAAIKAVYADYRRVRGRKCLQIILEVPLELAPEVHEAFGEPMPDGSTWVAVAKLVPETERKKQSELEKPKRSWNELSRAQQAGIACGELAFIKFLDQQSNCTIATPEEAAAYVRGYCNVESRADIEGAALSRQRWDTLYSDYRTWLQAAEVIG